MNPSLRTPFLALLFITTIFVACKEDKHTPTPQQPGNATQNLSFHIHNTAGSAAINDTATYQDAGGRKFKFFSLRYYMSNIVLIKSDGTEHPLTDKVLLVNSTISDYSLGSVPVGSYKGFKFLLGLDSVTNHKDPATYAAGSPLAIQSPSMHWSWSSGYIFMMTEGRVDTTEAKTGSVSTEYYYHVATDACKRTIDLSSSAFNVVAGSDKEVVLKFNWLKVLNNVDMRTEFFTHTFDNYPLAEKMANNWQSAFSVE